MAPAVRSFSVYRDDDEGLSAQAESSAALDKNLPPVPSFILPSVAASLIVFAPDKENINPATGLRANAEQSGKKRKTGVLAVKSQIPPKKKHKESKEPKETKPLKEKDSKKRAASSATKARSSSSGEKKAKRPLASRKNTGPSRNRRSPSLPRVVEEEDTEQALDPQAVVDAKCYELTVSPLADVSQAFEQAPSFEDSLALAVHDVKAANVPDQVGCRFYLVKLLLANTKSRIKLSLRLSLAVPPQSSSLPQNRRPLRKNEHVPLSRTRRSPSISHPKTSSTRPLRSPRHLRAANAMPPQEAPVSSGFPILMRNATNC